jgi:hypothetical protein
MDQSVLDDLRREKILAFRMKFPFWSRALCISENQHFCSRFVPFDGRAKRFLRAPELFIRDSRVLCRAPHLTAISAFSCDVHCYFSPDVSLTALEKSLLHSQFPKISWNLKIELPATMSVSPSNFSQLPKSLLTNDIRAFRSREFLKFFARANSKNRRFFSKHRKRSFGSCTMTCGRPKFSGPRFSYSSALGNTQSKPPDGSLLKICNPTAPFEFV